MTVLSDRDLATALMSGRLKLEGWSGKIGPASIDLYLSDDFVGASGVQRASGIYELQPFGFVLGSTVEFITLANNLCAQVAGCSSIARTGLQVECAGWVDPGFQGQLTAEIFNQTSKPYLLVPGMRIAQLVVFEMTSPAERPYGSPGVGRYQHQRGATPALPELP